MRKLILAGLALALPASLNAGDVWTKIDSTTVQIAPQAVIKNMDGLKAEVDSDRARISSLNRDILDFTAPRQEAIAYLQGQIDQINNSLASVGLPTISGTAK